MHGALRELALQTQELINLLDQSDTVQRLIPVKDPLPEAKRLQSLATLKKLQDAVREMCLAFSINLDPIVLSHRLHTSAVYMGTVIKNMHPEHLKGYGAMSEDDEALLEQHIAKVTRLLNELEG